MAKKVMAQKGNNGVTQVAMSQTYEGPLPTPADFSAYKDALPSAPERIMVMAEEEQHYRQKINNKVVNLGAIESFCGMIVAFIVVMLCLGAAVYLALHDQSTVAIVLIGAVTSLAAIFYLKKQPTDK